jgi:hypothetical protein
MLSTPPRFAGLCPLFCLPLALALVGCGADAVFPNSGSTPAQVSLGTIQGSDYGGHAPIVSAHVYVLQAGTGGYGAKATSLLSASYKGSYPTALNTNTASPTYNMYYVTTDAQGYFNISGDYACTAGDPVYLYASGGNPVTTQPVTVTGASGAPDAAGNLLITFTTTGNQLLYQGESVTLGAFTPNNTQYQGESGSTFVVSPLNLTTTTFAKEEGQTSSSVAYASFSSTLTQATAPTNPAIANLAMLGLCPSATASYTITAISGSDDVNGNLLVTNTTASTAGLLPGEQLAFAGLSGAYSSFNGTTQTISPLNFTSTTFAVELGTYGGDPGNGPNTGTATPTGGNFSKLNFVYLNEVSTVAMAYAAAQFSAVGTAQNDGVHIGTSSTNLLGLQNAANNAANLYDIQGSIVGTGSDGDTHIARATTPAGNGQIPQKTLDTLGNILANCVDSANTYSASTAPGGTQSTQCATIFNNATSDGSLTGTKPNDTATAMFNIVTHPSGATSNPNFVSNLYNSITGNAPYQPSNPNQPNDFVIGIKYTGAMFINPDECGGDSQGNEWCADYGASTLTKLSPLGVVLYSFAVPNGPTHVMIDLNNSVWVASQNGNAVYEFTSAGVAVPGSPYTDAGAISTPAGISNDGSGHTVVANYGANNVILINGSGTTATFAAATTTCSSKDTTTAFDMLGYAWSSGGNANQACRIGSTGTLAATVTELSTPSSVDVDASNRAWIPNSGNNTLAEITPTTTTPFYTLATFTGGGLSGPSGIAIDGASNIWIGNKTPYNSGTIYSVSEFNNAGVAITGTGGYQAGQLNQPVYLSIDISGNIWFSNMQGASVEELIGAAVPVVRPKALAVSTGKLGARP